jgi:hypothetical protein
MDGLSSDVKELRTVDVQNDCDFVPEICMTVLQQSSLLWVCVFICQLQKLKSIYSLISLSITLLKLKCLRRNSRIAPILFFQGCRKRRLKG